MGKIKPQSDYRTTVINKAREMYQSDDIEIDDNAELSEGEDGTWVQGWVFLAGQHETKEG